MFAVNLLLTMLFRRACKYIVIRRRAEEDNLEENTEILSMAQIKSEILYLILKNVSFHVTSNFKVIISGFEIIFQCCPADHISCNTFKFHQDRIVSFEVISLFFLGVKYIPSYRTCSYFVQFITHAKY